MLQLYSRGCEYAIRALSVLRLRDCHRGFSVKDVCKRAGIPESFTRKIFQTLVRRGIFSAQTGPGGGYRFRKEPSQVTLLDFILGVDGNEAFEKCVMKDFKCDRKDHCSLHDMWTRSKASLIQQLSQTNVADLMIQDIKMKKERKR